MRDVAIIDIPSAASSLNQPVLKSSKNVSKAKQKMKDVEVIELTDDEDHPPPSLPLSLGSSSASTSSFRKLTRQSLTIDLDASFDDAGLPAEPRHADLTLVPGGSKGLQRHQRTGAERGLTHHADLGKYKGKNKADVVAEGSNMDNASHSLVPTVIWNGIDAVKGGGGASQSARNLVPGPLTNSAISKTASSSNLDVLQGLPPQVAKKKAVLRGPPRPAPPPLLETPEETMSRYVAQVLEIIPDVDPEHCASLVLNNFPTLKEATVERVLHLLFEDVDYPKAKKPDKGKRKANSPDENDRPKKKARKDDADMWLSLDRPSVGGPGYHTLALNQLQIDYPYIPKAYLREQLERHNKLYAPTFFFLRNLRQRLDDEGSNLQGRPYEPLVRPHRPGKHKLKQDPDFDKELDWVGRKVAAEDGGAARDDNVDPEDADDADEEDGNISSDGEDIDNGIECGCCFSKFRFDKLSQCPDAHLFCHSCLRSYASTLLGSHNPKIACMSQSQCSHVFPAASLSRVLPRKTYLLYERLIQAQEIASAGLEGLEECPFCEWKCVFDVGFEGEKLFRCGNEEGGCGVVSCRKCKKLDHLPKSCEEAEKDKGLNARHVVEEAMTQALVRDCPKCKKAFIKEGGCNKMACPNCRALSCYLCRQVISGYEHFNQNPQGAGSSSQSSKCVLWDKDLEAMHASEVKHAAEKAIAEARVLHPDVSISDLKVDIPKTPKRQNKPPAFQPFVVAPMVAPLIAPLVHPPLHPAFLHHNPPPIPVPRRGRPPLAAPVPALPAVQRPHLHRHRRQNHHNHPRLQPHPHPHPHPRHQAPAPQNQPQAIPDREAFAQAMMGQYQPAGGGVEIAGRVLRNRAGRGGPAQQQQVNFNNNYIHNRRAPAPPPPAPAPAPHPHPNRILDADLIRAFGLREMAPPRYNHDPFPQQMNHHRVVEQLLDDQERRRHRARR